MVVDEDVLEDATAQWWPLLGDDGDVAAAVPVTEPIDREMAHDGDEPGGAAGAVVRLCRVGAQLPEIVLAQGFAHPREHVHHVVVILGVVADGREDEAPVAIEKQVPRGFRAGLLQLRHPVFHHRTNLPSAAPRIKRGLLAAAHALPLRFEELLQVLLLREPRRVAGTLAVLEVRLVVRHPDDLADGANEAPRHSLSLPPHTRSRQMAPPA